MSELGDFLRAKRAAASVEALPFPSSGRRRVPGLRRDEVALLAGVSVDYYTRLEQGRETNPSAQVLDALAHSLDLTVHERRYAYELAQLVWVPELPQTPELADTTLTRLMERWPGAACFVLDPLLDIVATNRLATQMFRPFATTRNLVEMVFLDPAGRTFYVDWERAATGCVANLRATSGLYAGTARRKELLDRLTSGSTYFAELWTAHEVVPKTHDQKTLRHPDVGEFVIDFDALEVSAMPGHQLVVYGAEPGSAAERAFQLLSVMPTTSTHDDLVIG
ncbi:XRE family transcriptional regulator [Xylanimonas oleitrophica]|uniref:XRE family transcriptional regulator n=1 Tax=Xylanimonas oleitrophica TaxID=2607479 RepID=A0A2W5WPP4_9MICO|nr:helix-turn-helix transcriptional regulator [Xylanimonas oleitrophica]PZR53377.1 XRE family transcriptional regulator [Xylanimonas oleitrophica]